MPRIPRRHLWTDAACYHILNRGHNRTAIFADDEDRIVFLSLLARYRQRYAFRLFHYCLMSNHFHLLLQLQSPRQLSTFMAGLLRAYVHHCHRRHQFVGHLWQGRFKSPVIQKDDYWLSCGRYIERNPVEAGLVAEPWQYRWSSAACYAWGTADSLVEENPCYQELAVGKVDQQRLWRAFLVAEDEREDEVRRGDWAVGDARFRDRMGEVRGRPLRRRGRPRKSNSRS
ncbi:MAG TPA: transposase [Gemmataceae bacterium]|nr:transposase [Gemmataceae bacterium]